jgi:BirA family biotin operon repressor/biotin-[acetyl-CoA-carboxylase] ligase
MGLVPTWVIDLQKSRRARLLGKEILYLESVDSTNRRAREEALQGGAEGLTVIADSQSQGKGRMGRSWSSPAGINLYFSILLRPPLPPDRAPQLTLLTGVSSARAIRRVTGLEARLKWPNDIFISGKKAAGILAEMEGESSCLHFVILGIGINVNWVPESMPAELRETATSLRAEAGKEFDRGTLAHEMLEDLERDYALFRQEGFSEKMREEWNRLSLVNGKRATLTFLDHKISGEIKELDRDGALLFVDQEGITRRFVAGDISLRI